MKTNLAAAVLCAAMLVALPAALAQQQPETPLSQEEDRDYTPHKRTKEEAAKLVAGAEERVRTFADYINAQFDAATESSFIGWGFLAGAGAVGLVSLFFGWTLVQTLLVPCAPVVGLATGAVISFSLVEAFYEQSTPGFRIALMGVGCLAGIALFLFAAVRAKPIAALLVVMAPFLILASVLFPFSDAAGLAVAVVGFVAGFMAMVSVRPLCIFGTSLLGAMMLISVFGLLAHLGTGTEGAVRQAWDWFVAYPLMLAILLGIVSFLGLSFQFSTGPRGSLQT